MTLGYRFVLGTVMTLGTATGMAAAAGAQQWGPPAQSKVYHDSANQTLTAYNTSTTTAAPQQTAPQAATRPATRPATTHHRTAAATATASSLHRTTYHQSGQ